MIDANMTGLGIFQALTRGHRIREAAQHALEAEAETLADAIREAAPERTGNLRESVRVEPGDEPMKVVVTAGGTPETTKTTKDGRTFDEALMTEYGTSHSAAEPFFWPTVEANRDKIKANIDDTMGDAASTKE